MTEIRIPLGMRDEIQSECILKRKLQKKIENIFINFGYAEIKTPVIEFYDTYQTGYAQVRANEMYKFFDQEGEILTLRADMTVPIARVVASKYANVEPPFRLFYTSDVFKVRHVFAGKRGEVTDCGIELIGLDSNSDVEVLYMALKVMEQLTSSTYQLEIGNAGFFKKAIEIVGVNEEEKNTLADLIDRKSMVDLDSYVQTLNIDQNAKAFFKQLPLLSGGKEVLLKAKEICFSKEMEEEVTRLETLYNDLEKLGMSKHVSFDFGKVPHLDYYTGIIFEGYITDSGTSVLSGGRYDGLLKKFNRDLPACGFSVKLDYVVDTLDEKVVTKTKLYYPKGKEVEAIQKAEELREENNVEMIPWEKESFEVRQ